LAGLEPRCVELWFMLGYIAVTMGTRSCLNVA
jgi:hypothetical protein